MTQTHPYDTYIKLHFHVSLKSFKNRVEMSAQITLFTLFQRIFVPRVWPWITLLIAAVMAYALHSGLHALPLALRGVTTQATETSLRATSHICQSDRCGPVTRGQRYWRTTRDYTFTTPSGQQVQARNTQRLSHEPRHRPGASRAVIYMARDPSRHMIGGRRAVMQQLVISAALTLAVLGFLGYEIVTSFRRARQGMRVMQTGARRKARVTAVPSEARGNAQRALYWALPGGRTGHSLPLPKQADRPGYGSEIEVYDDGQASWWVADLQPEKTPRR